MVVVLGDQNICVQIPSLLVPLNFVSHSFNWILCYLYVTLDKSPLASMGIKADD